MSLELVGQTSWDNYLKIHDLTNSKNYNKVDSLISREIELDSIENAIKIIHDYSLKLYREEKYDSGLKYVKWEESLYKNFDPKSKEYINILFNAGLFSYKNLNYKESLNYYLRLIQLDEWEYRKPNAYFELGRVFFKLGDYQKSVNYLFKRLNFLKKTNLNYNSMISCYINLHSSLAKINTRSSSLMSFNILNEADSISKLHDIEINRYLDLQESLGQMYSSKFNFNFNKSRNYRKINLKIGLKYNDSTLVSKSLNNLAYLYNLVDHDSAFYYINRGLGYARTPEEKARLFDNLADFNIRKGDLNAARKNIHTSLEIMTSSTFLDVPSRVQLKNSSLLSYSLYCLKKKAEIELRLFYDNKQDFHLKSTISNINMAEYVVNLLINSTTEEATQLIWRREASQAYLYGAYAAHLLGDSKQAFEFMEKNKALLLSESVLRNTEFANLPKHISDEETNRKKKIYSLESRLNEDSDNASLQDSLFIAKRSHEKFVDSLKTEFPKYFARKINVDQVPLSEMQKELASNQAVVSYIWNDFDRDKELVVGLISTKDSTKTFVIEEVHQLKKDLLKYRELISKPFSTKSDQIEFQQIAFQLFQQLVPSKDLQKIIAGKDLMIIADGQLQNIPFESLIRKKESNEYLFLDSNIHYSYSYSFLKHNEKINRKSENSFIGYSPVSFKDSTLIKLVESQNEIENIQSRISGEIRLKGAATKNDFLKSSSDAKIIHLATHADAGENPWIAFADEKLALHELYTYKNKAELVTLSACNTSLGEMAKGEGVISLARGFFHSGSESVVSSLWKVNDKVSSEIMESFYNNLLKGQSKTKALNNAKRTYLKNHSLSEQSPYYWSSFVLIGDSNEIDINSNNYLFYGLLLLIIPIGFVFRKKLKKVG